MDRPQRKKLRLAEYDYSSSGAYFVTVCTKDRKPLLSTVVGADAFIGPHVKLSAIGEVVEKYIRSIPGIGPYTIMPNHVHMVIYIPEVAGPMRASAPTEGACGGPMRASAPTEGACGGPMRASAPTVGDRIRSWKKMVSRSVGIAVWQRSYYDHIIRDENEHTQILEYIQNNPAKWCEDRYYPGY